jgi:arsenite methyltransferase
MGERIPSPSFLNLACCADLYHLPVVRTLIGDSLHPGGLALTRMLAKELKLTNGQRLLDVACGRGASAIMLAQVYKCQVVGVDADPGSIEAARKDAGRYRLDSLVIFAEGDATRLPFAPAHFDAAMCECATSIFSDRRAALSEIARVLRPGGRLALSDVTCSLQTLPAPLDWPLAQALCIPLGMGPEEYVRLIEDAGLTLHSKADCSATIVQLLEKIETFFGVARLAAPAEPTGGEGVGQIGAALKCARQLVQQGELGYWAFIAQKPEKP